MGTRSTVKFYEDNDPLLSVYQQYDGYISGVGRELAEFLKPIEVVNGFGGDMKAGTHANGMGCLAAQYVAENKKEIGGFYITTPEDTEEYNYEVRLIDGKIQIKETSTGFEGTPDELLNYKEKEADF